MIGYILLTQCLLLLCLERFVGAVFWVMKYLLSRQVSRLPVYDSFLSRSLLGWSKSDRLISYQGSRHPTQSLSKASSPYDFLPMAAF